MGFLDQTGNSGKAADKRSLEAVPEDTVWAPSIGGFLTDGTALFRVAHALSDNAKGELLLELEDCGTLEVVLCPARAVTELGLRSVTPSLQL